MGAVLILATAVLLPDTKLLHYAEDLNIGKTTVIKKTMLMSAFGVIRARAGYIFTSAGFNKFDYRLYTNGVLYNSLPNTTDTLFSLFGSATAIYRVRVTAPNVPFCPEPDEQFTPPFLVLATATGSGIPAARWYAGGTPMVFRQKNRVFPGRWYG